MKLSKPAGSIFTWAAAFITSARLSGTFTRRNDVTADDTNQEAIVRALAVDDENLRSPERYIRRIATNVAIDQYRRERARGGGRTVTLEDAHDAPALAYLPDQESALLLKQIILALPPLYRDVFILSRFMGLTYAEIATRYGLSVKAVEYRMSRALALCEDALRD